MRAIVFGAKGSIGQAICAHFIEQGYKVIGVSRNAQDRNNVDASFSWIRWGDPSNFAMEVDKELNGAGLDALVWAQGINFNDDINDFNAENHLNMYEANVTFILTSLQTLLNHHLLKKDARLCVISSIWQNIARQKKLSYCITKSALQGLVQSLSIDLGKQGFLINAVLPGALDTAMTRSNLNSDQIHSLEGSTPLQTLPNLTDVTGLVGYLCSKQNTGITGQFIAADRGFSNARIL